MQKQRQSTMALVRIDLGITQQQLANSLGISRSLLSMAERGARRLPPQAAGYLHQLLRIAKDAPPTVSARRRPRPSVASKRPAYNRIPFSTRKKEGSDVHIATLSKYKSVLSPQEILNTGYSLRDRYSNDSKIYPDAVAARQELLRALGQKKALLHARLKLLQLELLAAGPKAVQLKNHLLVTKARLKAFRQLFKEHWTLRKTYRKKIAAEYLKKLRLEEQREKFNKPALLQQKQAIAALQAHIGNLEKLVERIMKYERS